MRQDADFSPHRRYRSRTATTTAAACVRLVGRSAPTVDAMRFRRREWDVAMPDALVSYWTAWNEPDLERIRDHLVGAVT